MRLCNIVPVSFLDDVLDSDERTHLVIADRIVEDETYLDFYQDRKDRGDFIILDSSAFETGAANTDMLMEAWHYLQPNEVVLPDLFNAPNKSTEWTKAQLLRMRELGLPPNARLMAVPHGNTLEAYMESARTLASLTGVKTIGIQEEVQELFGQPRSRIVKLCQRLPVTIHLLGFQEDLEDLKDEWNQRNVRSADSAKLVVWGLNGMAVPVDGRIPEYPGRKSVGGGLEYLSYDIPEKVEGVDPPKVSRDDAVSRILSNIKTWRKVVQ